MEHKDAMERGIQTKTQRHAHSTQRHRDTEAQREELNIELKKTNYYFEFYVQFFPLFLCVSVPLC
jgi:hypothetical protein